jgi:hypothetical protein
MSRRDAPRVNAFSLVEALRLVPAQSAIRCKWFFRLLVALDIKKDTKKCVHSLRDTTINKMIEVGVSDDINRKLVGHIGVDIHGKKYVQPKLKVLRENLEKVDFRPLLKGLL